MQARPLACLCPTLLAGLMLAGCATIEGAPQRVIDDPMMMGLVRKYPMDEAITNFSHPDTDYYNWTYRGGLTRQQYRDMVIRVYMSAMDSRYSQFKTMLSSERRQADFGLDLAVLGFTGWASVAKASIVNNLSAVAAGFAGTRGLVDKDLYFAKAVPALTAAMDADRFRAQAQIETNLKKAAGDYPLQTAFGELINYEVATSLDNAVNRITTEATEDKEDARAELAQAVEGCEPEEGAGEIARRIDEHARALVTAATPAATNELRLMAIAMKLSPIGEPGDIYSTIQDKLSAGADGQCRKADLEKMVADIKGLTGKDI